MRFRRSPAQIAAARRNGALSKGPVTPEGKQICAQSSRKHGVYAKAILLPGESEAEFSRLGAQLNARFKPRDPVESMYIQRMLVAQWRYLRVWNLEQAGLVSNMEDDPDHPPTLAHLGSFVDLHGTSRNALLAAETRFLRQYDQAVAKLAHLRSSPHLRNFGAVPTSNSEQRSLEENEGPESLPAATQLHPPVTQPDPPSSHHGPEPPAPAPASELHVSKPHVSEPQP